MTPPVTLSLAPDRSRARLRMFHPKGNIITLEIIERLAEGLTTLGGEPHLKLITIEGEGPDFSFGASIPEHAPGEIERVLPESHRLTLALLDAPAPTAAVVRGRCLGGGFEIALACDFIFASDSASLTNVARKLWPCRAPDELRQPCEESAEQLKLRSRAAIMLELACDASKMD